jgi:SAM-dependent methyltransferase
MILQAAGDRVKGAVLENGCGVGMYLEQLARMGGRVAGLEYDFQRAAEAASRARGVTNAAGERLPFASQTFDFILSHEVIEHVQDDRDAVGEMVRVLKPQGRIALFCPNRGYPFETHGIYWRGKYRFGNKLFVNYLPRAWRNRLAPHVRAYSASDLERLFAGLPIRFIQRTVVFGAYDNIIARAAAIGQALRGTLQFLEKTPLRVLGLSHYWVVERT